MQLNADITHVELIRRDVAKQVIRKGAVNGREDVISWRVTILVEKHLPQQRDRYPR